jgi:prepilin signal peptidase PulO-like enzyme (type II secretory pathway)
MELYEIFMIPGIILSIIYSLVYKDISTQNLMIGIAFGFGFFALQYILTKGKGIGSGDLRLGLIMGALLGWPLVLASIMIAYISGSIISLIFLAIGKLNTKSAIPLGVFLIPALVITFLFKTEILVQMQSYFSGLSYIF